MTRKLRRRLGDEDFALINEASVLRIGDVAFSRAEKRFVEQKLEIHFDRYGEKDRKRDTDTVRAVHQRLSRSSEDGSQVVFDAIRRIGLAAIGPAQFEGTWIPALFRTEEDQKETEALLHSIRDQIWRWVSQWYQEAHYSDLHHIRSAAAQHLRDLGSVLAGDRRGQRQRRIGDRIAVLRGYYERLFRLRCAMMKLKSLIGVPPRERAIQAARESGLTEPHIPNRIWDSLPFEKRQDLASRFFHHLHYQSDTDRFGRPATVEATARLWTAQWAGVTEQTISNLLSHHYRK